MWRYIPGLEGNKHTAENAREVTGHYNEVLKCSYEMKNRCWYRMNNEDQTKKANHDPSYVGSHQITESYILATALLTNSKISGELVQSL